MSIIHLLSKNTENTYIYRVYTEPGTLRYKLAIPVSYRENGEFEVHAWNTARAVFPEAPLSLWADTMLFIMSELSIQDKRFKKLTGTFERDRLKTYKRMFSKVFDIVVLREIELNYNKCKAKAFVVEFKKRENII